ncbi:MAG: hypothetical protein JO085_02615 [Acidimicrobiia bacterium]|nr:hypothetical protein [Acidimicrobiia bacterium]
MSSQVSSQSVFYSPSNGCLSGATHPIPSPCEPFLYAQATGGKGSISVAPPSGYSGKPIKGVELNSAQLDMSQVDSAMQIEQTSKVQGSVSTGSAALTVDNNATTVGGASASSQADNDPAAPAGTQPPCPTSQGVTTPNPSAFDGGGINGITMTASAGDSGCTVSTAAATSSASPACTDVSGTALNTTLPCGSGSVQQQGSTAESAALSLGLNGLSLGATTIASVAAAPTATKTFTTRLTSPLGNYCTTTNGDGCVHADAQRSIGTVTLGALPAAVALLVPNWGIGSNNFLVQLTGYSDAVSAESGIGAAAPCAKQAATCAATSSGSIKYWNGSGYATAAVNWGASPPTLNIPSVNASVLISSQLVNVSITNTLTFGSATTTSTGTAPCRAAECQATAQITSPIQGDIIYAVTIAGTTVANVDISVNLGSLAVQTNYKAAPLAG